MAIKTKTRADASYNRRKSYEARQYTGTGIPILTSCDKGICQRFGIVHQ